MGNGMRAELRENWRSGTLISAAVIGGIVVAEVYGTSFGKENLLSQIGMDCAGASVGMLVEGIVNDLVLKRRKPDQTIETPSQPSEDL